MKTLSLILISLSFGLFNLNAVAAESDKNSPRCNSLPFSLEGIPETGPDQNIEYKGKLIDGITHVFYPSGKLQRRGKRGVDFTWEYYSEDCYLISKKRWENNINVFGEFYEKGNLLSKGPYNEKGEQHGIWEYFENGALIKKELKENHLAISAEFYKNGNLTMKGPWSADGNQDGTWQYYENGTLTAKVTWQNGEFVKEVRITAPWPVTIGCSYKTMDVTGIYIGMDLANNKVYTQSIDSFQSLLNAGIQERPDFDVYESPYVDDSKVVWRANVYGKPVKNNKEGGRRLTLNRGTLKLTEATTGRWTGQYINCDVLDPKDTSYQDLNDYLEGKWKEFKSAREEKLKKRAF